MLGGLLPVDLDGEAQFLQSAGGVGVLLAVDSGEGHQAGGEHQVYLGAHRHRAAGLRLRIDQRALGHLGVVLLGDVTDLQAHILQGLAHRLLGLALQPVRHSDLIGARRDLQGHLGVHLHGGAGLRIRAHSVVRLDLVMGDLSDVGLEVRIGELGDSVAALHALHIRNLHLLGAEHLHQRPGASAQQHQEKKQPEDPPEAATSPRLLLILLELIIDIRILRRAGRQRGPDAGRTGPHHIVELPARGGTCAHGGDGPGGSLGRIHRDPVQSVLQGAVELLGGLEAPHRVLGQSLVDH